MSGQSGRNLYRYMRPVIAALTAVLSIFPQVLLNWLWSLTDLLPNLFAVGFRYAIAKASGCQMGDNVYFGRNTTVKHWKNIQIGSNVSIHENCFIDALGTVRIGNDVSIAHASSLVSFDHDAVAGQPIKYGPLLPGAIQIEDDVWIAAGVRVLKDSVIEKRAIVGANAVVKGRLAGGAVYGGIPAKKIGDVTGYTP